MRNKHNRTRKTEHARKRLQQRAINEDMVRLIEAFGQYHYQKGGGHIAFIDKKRIVALRQALDHLSGVQLVIGESETVVTAMHRTRPTRTTLFAA